MDIRVSQAQGRVPVTIFHIRGQINAAGYDELLKTADEAYLSGTKNILLDLSEVPYISSAAFRAFHHIFNLLRTDSPDESDDSMRIGLRDGTFKSPHLKLLNPSAHVMEAIKMTGFDMFLEVHSSQKAALESFQSPQTESAQRGQRT